MINNKLNNILNNISIKKQYLTKLKNKTIKLTQIKQQEKKMQLFQKSKLVQNHLIKYIINITFLKTNTLIHVTDFSGNLKFFMSAGQLQYKGKEKTVRQIILKKFYKVMLSKFQFLKSQPIVVNLKNVQSSKFWILKLLKKVFFIKVVRVFISHPYNGCRKKKVRRKKIRTRANRNITQR